MTPSNAALLRRSINTSKKQIHSVFRKINNFAVPLLMKFYHEYTEHEDPVLYASFQQVTHAYKLKIKLALMHLDKRMDAEGGCLIFDGKNDLNIRGFSAELTQEIEDVVKKIDWDTW
jgi:hypothetical protein